MQEKQEKKRKRRHKKKKSHKLYAAIVLTLGIVIICMTILLLFYVQRIEIQGNTYCSDKEIAEAVQNDRFSINTLYVTAKYAMGKGEVPNTIETMQVSLKNPWTLRVTVEEKEMAGYLKKKKKNFYFDKDGMVVFQSNAVLKGVPQVKGAKFKNVKIYHYLESENENVFDEICFIRQELKKHELSTEKILYVNDRVYVYIGKVCVSLGTEITADKMAQIPPILKKLGKKKGTLHLENYSGGNETITFAIGEFPK